MTARAATRQAPAAAPRVTSARLVGLDRLRAVALLLMLFHHFSLWLSGAGRELLPGGPRFTVTDIAAPAFAIAAGASLLLFTRQRSEKGATAADVTRSVIRRYGLLVFYGIGLDLVIAGDAVGFGVLHALGTGTVVAHLLHRAVGRLGTRAVAAGLLAVAPLVETVADRVLTADSLPHEFFGGTFPVVFYTGLIVSGAVAADAIIDGRDRPREAMVIATICATAVATLVALGAGLTRYPGGYPFLFAGIGATALTYAAASAWRPAPGNLLDCLLRAAARHTLGIFLAHYAVRFALDRAGWRGVLGDGPALVAAVALMIAFTVLAPRVPPPPVSPRGVSARRQRRLGPEHDMRRDRRQGATGVSARGRARSRSG